ncbi:MAG TPA: type II secretion system protein [Candidatus Paceibacterota bacterium]|jgi:prepilin-type N-terminal cleavage/methylation domain-containing protein|nr:type II secretion system protein [Candidatus Paceibacterota bacterium]
MVTHFVKKQKRGFTLIEMLVSVAIFATVMTIALGALLAMSESDRKAQTLKSVINNLNFALDDISRTMRTGMTYDCNASGGTTATAHDCATAASAGTAVGFTSADNQNIRYCRGKYTGSSWSCDAAGAAILVSKAGASYAPLTSSEVIINNLQFYVTGAESATVQPHVVILLSGSVQVSGSQTSSFDLETSVTQRLYDQ